MMRHEADPVCRKQSPTVGIEIMGDEDADGTAGRLEGRQHGLVAAAIE